MLKLQQPFKQKGSTLVELMIAMVVSIVIMLGMITVTVSTVQKSHENLKIIRLDQELRAAMDIMIGDIQRAGYWRDVHTDAVLNRNTNPFMVTGTTDLSITGTNCILFSYDRNKDGAIFAVNTGTDDERYGFRLITIAGVGAIQVRPASAGFNCAAANTSWEDLTDRTVINIANLQFTTTGSQTVSTGGASTITVRKINITITGNLVGDAATTRTITESVRVQNDKFTP